MGTSMPTSDLPGMGARMRTVEAASASARSSASAVTRESRTPLAISTSNSVTVGPATQSTTRDGMSKVASVSAIALAVERCSASEALCAEAPDVGVCESMRERRQREALERPRRHRPRRGHGLASGLGIRPSPGRRRCAAGSAAPVSSATSPATSGLAMRDGVRSSLTGTPSRRRGSAFLRENVSRTQATRAVIDMPVTMSPTRTSPLSST